jgi:hypothetical protein
MGKLLSFDRINISFAALTMNKAMTRTTVTNSAVLRFAMQRYSPRSFTTAPSRGSKTPSGIISMLRNL